MVVGDAAVAVGFFKNRRIVVPEEGSIAGLDA